ncbi:MAG: malonyl-[acyl-carrier protein] O-methyltransferase BioC [Gammaproteobacteria bacterium]|nr:MAG: malonyl-[acyl-carrier protein] O-methyltransferase BioC [Gammaproteobacteria bacterium]
MRERTAWRLDRHAVRRAFARAAATYDAHDFLQREIAGRLLERLDWVSGLAVESVLDAGCGTGRVARRLQRRYPRARVLGLDLAEPMLQRARDGTPPRRPWRRVPHWLAGTIEALPLADGTLDLVVSNLALQWCDPPDRALAEFRRVLRPGGMLFFSTFGPETLQELRQAWAEVDDRPHVHRFPDVQAYGDLMLAGGWVDPVVDRDRLRVSYPDLRTLLGDLRGVGARNLLQGRARGLTGRRAWQRFEAACARFRDAEGRLAVTWEVIYGHGLAGALAPGEAPVRFQPVSRS